MAGDRTSGRRGVSAWRRRPDGSQCPPLTAIDLGFVPHNLLVITTTEPESVDRARHDAKIAELLGRLRGVSGVESVAGVYRAPLQGPIGLDTRVLAEGDPLSRESLDRHPPVNAEGVTPEYFATMRIRILAGRPFTSEDGPNSPGVVIISESLARQMWPGQSAIGRRMLSMFTIRPVRSADGQLQWQTVVGVAADVRYREIDRSRCDAYLPVAQATAPVNDIVIRTRTSPESVIPAARLLTHAVDPGSAARVRTMDSMVAAMTSVWRMTLVIMSAFAAWYCPRMLCLPLTLGGGQVLELFDGIGRG